MLGLIVASLLYTPLSRTLGLFVMSPEIVAARVAEAQAWELSNNLAYGKGSFLDAAREHTREFVFTYDNIWQLWGSLGWYVQVATTTLIGFYIGRNGYVHHPVDKRV